MLRLISKIYSLFIVAQIASIELSNAFHNNPLRRYGLLLLTIPVIYHLIQDLFFKNKTAKNKALKIYSLVYIFFYVLWCLFDIIYYALHMGHISGYMAYMLYLAGMLFIAPLLYSFTKNLFPESKAPIFICIAYIILIFLLSALPGGLNESGFYDINPD